MEKQIIFKLVEIKEKKLRQEEEGTGARKNY